jgi:transposase
VLSLPAGVRIWLVAGFTDMRRGIDGLAALVQTACHQIRSPGSFSFFEVVAVTGLSCFGPTPTERRNDGMCLFYNRLHHGKFVWTHASDGVVQLSAAQLTTLLEGIDWRRVHRGGTAEGDAPPPTLAA